jgi:tRNA (cytidine/uridine-2'-O-)-methyltransferase
MSVLPAHQLRLALFQPDQPQNTGAMLRLCACLGLGMDIIEPCGFVLDDARLRRVAMDYGSLAHIMRHQDWTSFYAQMGARRLVLLTTKAAIAYTACVFRSDDVLLVGQESAGVPENVHNAALVRVTIPMVPEARSLNVGIAAAIVAGEAIRQCGSVDAG